MKTILSCIFMFFTFINYAQFLFNETIPINNNKSLSIEMNYPSVEVEAWDRDEIQVVGLIKEDINFEDLIFELEVYHTGNEVKLKMKKDDDKNARRVVVMNKEDKRIVFESYSRSYKELKKIVGRECGDCNFTTTTILSLLIVKVKIPQSLAVNIKSCYGNIEITNCNNTQSLDSRYGYISARFEKQMPVKNIELHSKYDFVEIILPEDAACHLDLKTSYGEIYSNFDIKMLDGSLELTHGQKINGEIKGGGRTIKASSPYDNIYLRKL